MNEETKQESLLDRDFSCETTEENYERYSNSRY